MNIEPEDMDREYTPELQDNGTIAYVFQNTYVWYCTAFGYWLTIRFKDEPKDEFLNDMLGADGWVRLH